MTPLAGLRLLLPALVPSWRFFDAVTASPRVDYALLTAPNGVIEQWHEFRPRPAFLPVGTMLRRLLWNPQWNENLFLVSLAERLMSATTLQTQAHSERELLLRVARHLGRNADTNAWLQIRLRFVSRDEPTEQLVDQIVYLSYPRLMAELMTP
jgi:hypothetical protein